MVLLNMGPSLNPWVSEAFPSNYILNSSLNASKADYILDQHEGWKYVVHKGQSVTHLANGIARQAGLIDELPLTFPFQKEPLTDTADIVIAPFGSKSASDIDHRVWQIDKWVVLLSYLPTNLRVTVIGTDKDDYSSFKGCDIISGKSLQYIAGLLTKCKLFISIDSGPANLATLLGVRRHVLLYPHNCEITANPYAVKVRVSKEWPFVQEIPVEPVIQTCLKCLKDIQHVESSTALSI